MESHADRVEVILDRGSVECKVAKRHGRPPFVVRAGSVQVEVVGTRFAVTRDGDGANVSVTEGIVKVISGGKIHRVAGGQHWHAGEVVAAAGETVAQPTEVGAERGAASSSVGNFEQEPAAKPALQNRSRKSDEPKKRSPRELFELAASLERSDSAKAIRLYGKVAQGAGPWASNALYAQASLLAETGRKTRAAKLLRRYLERFPQGANAEDARRVLRSLLGHNQ
jgi:hypothetical protein